MSAQELGLTWEGSDDSPGRNPHPSASVDASPFWGAHPQGTSFYTGREDVLTHVRTLLRPDPSAVSSISASSDLDELNLPEQEHAEREGLVQAIMQWLQTQPNWVLIVDNAGAVALVVSK
jgi:hypothetical protein